jgi:drug/metabolite transporter (DMT)-like permease
MTWLSDRIHAVPGAILILGYSALNAFKSVFEGAVLVAMSPAFLAVHVFVLAQATYFLLHRDRQGLFVKARSAWPLVVGVNITTALSWLAVLYALNYLEPAVVNSLVVGCIPLMAIVLAPILRPQVPVVRSEWLAGGCCALSVLLLIYTTNGGWSGLGKIPLEQVLLGVVAAVLTALGVTTNTFVTKSLAERGFSSADTMAVRFTLLNVLAAALTTSSVSLTPYTAQVVLSILAITVFGVFIGVYLLQIGIAKTEPLTASLLFSTNLAFTCAAQLLDPRLSVSSATLVGVALLTIFTTYGAVAASRTRRSLAGQRNA